MWIILNMIFVGEYPVSITDEMTISVKPVQYSRRNFVHSSKRYLQYKYIFTGNRNKWKRIRNTSCPRRLAKWSAIPSSIFLGSWLQPKLLWWHFMQMKTVHLATWSKAFFALFYVRYVRVCVCMKRYQLSLNNPRQIFHPSGLSHTVWHTNTTSAD